MTKNIGLIALEDIKKIEEIIPKIIINEEDKDKKGRQILTDPIYSFIGISQLKTEEGIILILILGKHKTENEKETLEKPKINTKSSNGTVKEEKKKIMTSNKDNNLDEQIPNDNKIINNEKKNGTSNNINKGKNGLNNNNVSSKIDGNKNNQNIKDPLSNNISSTNMKDVMNEKKCKLCLFLHNN